MKLKWQNSINFLGKSNKKSFLTFCEEFSTLFCKNWSDTFEDIIKNVTLFSLYFTKLFCLHVLYLTLLLPYTFGYMTGHISHAYFIKGFLWNCLRKHSPCTLQDSALCPYLDYLVRVQENWQWLIRVGIQCIDGRHV